MHAIGLEHAYGYSQANNGSNVSVNSNALGSTAVNIAIIDTGEDPNHQELASKIVRQRCFITNATDAAQSTGDYTLEEDGRGTNVSGIAAAGSNNGLGFSGAGGKVSIFAYRVFPTPDDNCANLDSSDKPCEANTADIASAITDAVNNGANVISMSLGGSIGTGNSGCTENGVDGAQRYRGRRGRQRAPGEGVAPPSCDSGVIALGATSVDDGQPNGTALFGGTAASPVEYVTSYSQYGSPGTAIHSSSAWGIVAPGGDGASELRIMTICTGSNISERRHRTRAQQPMRPYGRMRPRLCEQLADHRNARLPRAHSLGRPWQRRTSPVPPRSSSPFPAHWDHTRRPAVMKSLLCSTTDQLTTTGSTQNQGCGRLNVYRAMATALGDSVLP